MSNPCSSAIPTTHIYLLTATHTRTSIRTQAYDTCGRFHQVWATGRFLSLFHVFVAVSLARVSRRIEDASVLVRSYFVSC